MARWFALLIRSVDIIRRPIRILPIRILLLVVVVFFPFLGVFLYLDARVVEDVLRRRDLTRGARAQWIAVFAGLPLIVVPLAAGLLRNSDESTYFAVLGVLGAIAFVSVFAYLLTQRAGMRERSTNLVSLRRSRAASASRPERGSGQLTAYRVLGDSPSPCAVSIASSLPVIPACAPPSSVPYDRSIFRTDVPMIRASSNSVTPAASAFDAKNRRLSRPPTLRGCLLQLRRMRLLKFAVEGDVARITYGDRIRELAASWGIQLPTPHGREPPASSTGSRLN